MPMHKLPSLSPHIRLFGKVNEDMLSEFFRQQAALPDGVAIILELSTSGGDADVGRRIAAELRLWQEHDEREVFFLGKTYVFSAGITIMAAVPASNRYLTRDCELLIHERKMQKTLKLEGALRACKAAINDVLAEVESGQRLEKEGFSALVKGTSLSLEDLENRVLDKDWYISADGAKELGLVVDLI